MIGSVSSADLLRQCFGVQLPVSEVEALAAAHVSPAVQNVDEFERAVRLAYAQKPAPAGPAASVLALRLAATAAVKTFVLSEAACKAAFEKIKNDPDIPHRFVDEGCIFRAHVASHKLEADGVYSEKVFCIPGGGDLRMTASSHPLGYTFAMFHVATCVFVNTATGPERRVLDPSLGDEPLTVEAWQTRMRGTSKTNPETSVYYTSRFILHPSDRDKAPTTWSEDDLEQSRAWNQDYKVVQEDMIKSNFYETLRELEQGAA